VKTEFGKYGNLLAGVQKKLQEDGAVWAFIRHSEEDYDLNVFTAPLFPAYEYCKDCKFLVEGVKIIYPFHVSPRITAQAGIFTIQHDPSKPLEAFDRDNYPRKDFDILQIRKWKVPSVAKAKILRDLNDVGVNCETIYPDIEGLATGIWQTEVMRSGTARDHE
jgi:hypothetical protein